jgi:hypothetical protein
MAQAMKPSYLGGKGRGSYLKTKTNQKGWGHRSSARVLAQHAQVLGSIPSTANAKKEEPRPWCNESRVYVCI